MNLNSEDHPEDIPYSVTLQIPTTKAARVRYQLAYALPKALSDCMTCSAITNAFEESGLYSPSSTRRKLESLPPAPKRILQETRMPDPNPTEGRPILSGIWLTDPEKIKQILKWKENIKKRYPEEKRKRHPEQKRKLPGKGEAPTSKPASPKGLYCYRLHSLTPLSHSTLSLHSLTPLSHSTLSLHSLTPLSHPTPSPHSLTPLPHPTPSPHSFALRFFSNSAKESQTIKVSSPPSD